MTQVWKLKTWECDAPRVVFVPFFAKTNLRLLRFFEPCLIKDWILTPRRLEEFRSKQCIHRRPGHAFDNENWTGAIKGLGHKILHFWHPKKKCSLKNPDFWATQKWREAKLRCTGDPVWFRFGAAVITPQFFRATRRSWHCQHPKTKTRRPDDWDSP